MTERGPRERLKVQTFCQSETGMKEYICLREVCVVCVSKYAVRGCPCLRAYLYVMCCVNLRARARVCVTCVFAQVLMRVCTRTQMIM